MRLGDNPTCQDQQLWQTDAGAAPATLDRPDAGPCRADERFAVDWVLVECPPTDGGANWPIGTGGHPDVE